MEAIILAAGIGRRLAWMGWDKPKCLLPIGDATLLGNILDSLSARGVGEACVVVGYQRELVEAEAHRHPIACTFIENADFAQTNTIYSLYLARGHLADGFLYFNADVWFDPAVLDRLIGRMEQGRTAQRKVGGQPAALLVLDEKRCGAEEVKVILDKQGRVVRLGKDLDPRWCAGEYLGIALFHWSIGPSLIEALERFCIERGQRNLYFEAAVDEILDAHDVRTVPLGTLPGVEIDTPQDYERAKALTNR